MTRVWAGLVLAGLLSGCVPAPLRAQPDALLQLRVTPAAPPVQPVTGEQGLYRWPGPGALLVASDRAAFVTSVVLPQGAGAAVLPAAQLTPGTAQPTELPATLGFTQVFTVASLEPLDLGGAAGARSVREISRVVEAAAASLPRGAYTVATTTYRTEQFGTLSVRASQPGAQVRVNDRPVGTAPVVVPDLPQGQVTVSVSLGGYQTFTQRVTIRPDTTSEVEAALRRVTGTLSVRSDVPASVLIEGQVAGDTPVDLNLRPGVFAVNVVPTDRTLKAQNILVRVNASRVTALVCSVTAGEYGCGVR
ncbi:PEGA domain-containing protein [Deinococcus knuensis]|uniref:PEGA domain-containing protein n=1 Tax=Deinococcus knuensis TaxID=1837380 RepID=UPI00166BCE97|nr:PEGA domain-containing protein [Deinococcus knuensis]